MVQSYQSSVIYRPLMSLIKVAHQVFHDFLFSQRNKAAKEDDIIGVCVCVCMSFVVRGRVEGLGEGRWSKFEKDD